MAKYVRIGIYEYTKPEAGLKRSARILRKRRGRRSGIPTLRCIDRRRTARSRRFGRTGTVVPRRSRNAYIPAKANTDDDDDDEDDVELQIYFQSIKNTILFRTKCEYEGKTSRWTGRERGVKIPRPYRTDDV
ncbi:hypothetical protein U1Q18_050861 [Sarracenia purpurea var. burkii]